ncbi:ATP-binding protein [Alkalihalobacillus deserti]|uniref:ATP-binding protein n=1 Tax=Alkalihalobacillus deserti TaxID=2879466 RepID=UPI001D136BDD|nr:sensor histidine kinase [Alkalihalobacillus deserti]
MKISLRLKILVMSFVVVVVSVMTSGWIMVNNITDAFEKEIEERAVAIARTVAQMPDIRKYVGVQGGEMEIQPIAESTRQATNVDYIVIIDMNSIRYSHPSEELIGKAFVGGDEREAMAEKEYVSRAQGTLGNSIRAFVPIISEGGGEQVGVAVVGILTPTFQSLIAAYSNDLLFSLIWGLFIGLIGSFLLAHHIKKQTFGLEPHEIAKLVEERSAVMQAMDIGIIALDEKSQITFMNRLAKQYFQGGKNKGSLHVHDIFPNSWEHMVDQLKKERKEQLINQNVVLFDKTYLLSLYPIQVKGTLVGTLLTMIDRTEANRMAEELTGVKALVDALRAQNHEYMNKLHSIAGLIQLERTDEALDVILDETENEENMILFLKERFKDYSLSGLLLGKRSRARELGITFNINQASYLKGIFHRLSSGDLVTITGNLIENAFEAFGTQAERRVVECLIQGDENHLHIKVKDNGKGITTENEEKIFDYGFSTKAKEGRGIGLALVEQIVTAHHGEITVESEVNVGTEITIKANRRG